MHTLSLAEVSREPHHLLADVERGKPTLVMLGDQPLFMAVPLGAGLDAAEVRLELAVRLFDHEQISLGTAARIAGLSISELIDELGRRQIAVARYDAAELERELDYFDTLADRG